MRCLLYPQCLSIVKLRVDATNPTGATQLYESAGFYADHMLVT
jgi:hypothetical protein